MPLPWQETFDPYLDRLRADVGPLALHDAHTHVGRNDPDGFKQTPDELLDGLGQCDARALVFAMHEPGGYTDGTANDVAIAAATAHPDTVTALCRVDPNAGDAAVAEARRALDAGAVGIKLHPRAERFTLSHPAVEDLTRLVAERGAPMLIHAGRGIPALGDDTVRLAGAHPRANLILAHAAVSDLAWIWRAMPDHPNLFVDTSWWSPSDVIALFALAPPGQVLFASDSPYGLPLPSAVQTLRCAVQAGLTAEQVQGVAGGQLTRLLAGEGPDDLGPPPGPGAVSPLDPLLERVTVHLSAALMLIFRAADSTESLALARLACDVRGDGATALACRRALELIELYETHLGQPPPNRPFPEAWRFLVAALYVARTPAAPLP